MVYALVDPRNDEVRYIGLSTRGTSRPRTHLSPRSRRGGGPKNAWLDELEALGLTCRIEVLQHCASVHEVRAAEVQQISGHKAKGARLTNRSRGGEGTRLKHLSVREAEAIRKAHRWPPPAPRTADEMARRLCLMCLEYECELPGRCWRL